MDSLYQIVYTSAATELFDRSSLMDLLKGSVQRNTRAGITGLLLYKEGVFMQALEGEETAAKALFARISRDPRHSNIITLIAEKTHQRDFPNSAMAFRDLNAGEKPPGYSAFLNTPLDGTEFSKDTSKARRLLALFKKNIR